MLTYCAPCPGNRKHYLRAPRIARLGHHTLSIPVRELGNRLCAIRGDERPPVRKPSPSYLERESGVCQRRLRVIFEVAT